MKFDYVTLWEAASNDAAAMKTDLVTVREIVTTNELEFV